MVTASLDAGAIRVIVGTWIEFIPIPATFPGFARPGTIGIEKFKLRWQPHAFLLAESIGVVPSPGCFRRRTRDIFQLAKAAVSSLSKYITS